MPRTTAPDADDLVTMQPAEPMPVGELLPPPPLDLIVERLGIDHGEAARRLNADPLADLRADRDVLEAAVAAEIQAYAPGTRLLGDGAIRAIARAAVSRQLELIDDVLNRPGLDVRERLTAAETGWL